MRSWSLVPLKRPVALTPAVSAVEGAKILVMRNPWLEFESVPLGEICARFGGGGHQRVGAVALKGERVREGRARRPARSRCLP